VHPAKSIVFFTTASGAGYGLLFLLCKFGILGLLPAQRWFGFTAFAVAFMLITAGLLSSTFHLGRAERAWRALSQWRTSWLSREGLAAVLTYIPTGLYALAWIFLEQNRGGLLSVLGQVGALACIATIYCTAMIYASLKAVRAWANPWVPAGYLVFSLMTGALLLGLLTRLFGLDRALFEVLAAVALAAGLLVKLGHWRYIDAGAGESTAESATGLGRFGRVRLFEAPHTQDNYLMREMGFRIARKHARKLRWIAALAGFVLPLALTVLALYLGRGVPGAVLIALATVSAGLGIVVERWLFFAEARHAVTL
jgi:sulfite dehydrogenase (quinone) subunit SoeC